MSATLVLDNLLAWSAQAAILVLVGALASLTLTHPRARLIFWQGILALALLLPAVEPWHQPMASETGSVSITASSAPVVIAHPPAFRLSWKREYVLILIAAGGALRFLWIGAGLFRLRRHRLDAHMLATPPVRFANPRVRWFVSTTVGGPVTFGFLNPSILLPARVVELDADLREAIAHHELAHVRRRDWLFVLLEESIRSLLWFHPAIWFVLSRIQLAREQVVDAEVVGLTRDRERYLDALVAVAAQRLLPDVAPAPLFLKKRQLAVRVAAVLKETRMSKPRLFLSYTTVCSAALLAVRLSVWMFPMQAPAQTTVSARASIVADGPGVAVEPGAKILHRTPVFYPPGVATAGTVIVESTVNNKGEVIDARVISGPDELRGAALASVLNWHFSPDGGLPPTVQSTIRFTTGASAKSAPPAELLSMGRTTSLYVKAIRMSGLSDELAEKVKAALPLHVGDAFRNDDLARVKAAAKEIDAHLAVGTMIAGPDVTLTIMLRPSGANWEPGVLVDEGPGVVGGVPGGVPGGVVSGVIGGVPGGVSEGILGGIVRTEAGPTASAAAQFPLSASGLMRVRVGGNVQSANLIKKVTPLYPPLAKQARIQGTVRFTALIGVDGSIQALQLVSGHPLLVESAQEAVRQWMYKPTLLNGSPVEVITQIDVNYTLSE
jgi:TonB family protein